MSSYSEILIVQSSDVFVFWIQDPRHARHTRHTGHTKHTRHTRHTKHIRRMEPVSRALGVLGVPNELCCTIYVLVRI